MDERRRVTTRGRRATDLTPDRIGVARFRRTYVFANAFEFWIALAAAATGLTYLLEPEALYVSSVGTQAGGLAYAWSVLYAVGGLLCLAGIWWSWRPSAWRLEAAGLFLLTAAVSIHALAVLVNRGSSGLPTTITYAALAAAMLMRARAVLVVTGVLRTEKP